MDRSSPRKAEYRHAPPAARDAAPIPADAGIGLRAPHFREALETKPTVAWWEVHSENYFGAGGPPHHYLERIRATWPLSLHGVGLSLGSADPLDGAHLDRLKALVTRYAPAFVSDHLCWSSIDGRYLNDLLPLPYTEEALSHVATRVAAIQEHLGREIMVENPSSYLEYADSSIPEPEFLRELAARAGCGLLLDINNVYVSACNHGFDAAEYIRALPAAAVREIHLAGHTLKRYDDGEIRIDTHDAPVCEDVWRLYRWTLEAIGPRPTLIEWDTDLPPLATLLGEARRAAGLLEECRAAA